MFSVVLGAGLAVLCIYIVPGLSLVKLTRIYGASFADVIATVLGASLLCFWLFFAVTFLLGIYSRELSIFACALAIVLAVYGNGSSFRLEKGQNIFQPYSKIFDTWKLFSGVNSAIFAALGAMVALHAYLSVWPEWSKFGMVFAYWDVIVSWNRWALEFTQGQYHPTNAAYPILLPATWSFIYFIQNETDVWIFARTSLSIPIFFFLMYCVTLAWRLCSTVPVIFLFLMASSVFPSPYTMTGLMDIPVALFSAFSLLCLWSSEMTAQTGLQTDRLRNLRLGLAICFATIAALTKQPGFLILFFVIGYVLVFHRQQIRDKLISVPITLSGASLLLFGAIFFGFSKDDAPIGNLAYLRDHSVTLSAVRGYWQTITYELSNAYGPYLLISLFFGGMLTLLPHTLRRNPSGALAFLIAVIGGAAWLVFLFYDIRNSYWVAASLAMAAAVGFDGVLRFCGLYLTNPNRQVRLFGLLLIGFVGAFCIQQYIALGELPKRLAFDKWDNNSLRERHELAQLYNGRFKLNEALVDFANQEGESKVLITDYGPAKYFSALKDVRIVGCHCNSSESIAKLIEEWPGSLVFFFRTNKVKEGYIDVLLEEGQASLAYDQRPYRIIRLK